jgi:hypothetical protein
MNILIHPVLHAEIGLLWLLFRLLKAVALGISMTAGALAFGLFLSASFLAGLLEVLRESPAVRIHDIDREG